MKASVIYLFLISLIIIFPGCTGNIFFSQKYSSKTSESKVIPLEAQTDFTILNTNGAITISSSDTAKNIYCNITKEVKSSKSNDDAKAHISDININTTQTSTGIKMKVEEPQNDGRGYIIKFKIIMPDNFNFHLSLGNGSINLNSSTKNLVMNIGNGNAEVSTKLKDNCDVSLNVGNGTIDFHVPDNINASISAKVGNGGINTSGLNIENKQTTNRTLNGKLGSGAGSIDLTIGNGSIKIGKI